MVPKSVLLLGFVVAAGATELTTADWEEKNRWQNRVRQISGPMVRPLQIDEARLG